MIYFIKAIYSFLLPPGLFLLLLGAASWRMLRRDRRWAALPLAALLLLYALSSPGSPTDWRAASSSAIRSPP